MAIFDFEGYGAGATGGEGGTVYTVSTWADMKTRLEQSGARIIRFSGDITATSQANITNDNFTLEVLPGLFGQIITDGTLIDSPIKVACDNFIIRRVASRRDPSSTQNSTGDCINFNGASNGMITQCSFYWGNDECVDVWASSSNLTFQWCVIAEPLADPYATGSTALGFLVGNNSSNVSIHHCLIAHYTTRGPRFVDVDSCEAVCNVMYNISNHPGQSASTATNIDFVKCYKVVGPDDGSSYVLQVDSTDTYYTGNDSTDVGDTEVSGSSQSSEASRQNSPSTPVTEEATAQDAYLVVIANAGTGDITDQRIIQDVVNRTGAIIDQPEDAGGWDDISNDLSFKLTSVETTTDFAVECTNFRVAFYEAGTLVHTHDFFVRYADDSDPWANIRGTINRFIARNPSLVTGSETSSLDDDTATDTDDPFGYLADEGIIAMQGERLNQVS